MFNPGLKLSSLWIENFMRSIGIEFFQSQGPLGIAAIQRRRNDDKNKFGEVESKGGSAGGSKRGSTGDPP